MKAFWLLVATAGAVAPLAAVGAAWWVGSALSAPVPRAVGPPPESLARARDVSFSSGSGSEIRAWHVPLESSWASVVLAHAVRSDRRQMRRRAELLHRAGYAVLLFDAQAHGQSPGDRITFGVREAHDAAAAVAYARSLAPARPVAYLGVSQGGAAALLGPGPLRVEALVLEAVYTTLREAVENRIAIRLGAPGRLLAPLLLWQLGPRLGVPAESVSPIRGIGEIRAPLLLIAGERDRRATLPQSRALFLAAPEPKELWVVPGATHRDFERFAPLDYERRVLDFLARALAGGPSD